MLTLILADTELETVPEEVLGHPSVAASARRRKRKTRGMLLDATLHHSAMRRMEDGERRGRPDIAHIFLLLALDSIANQEGRLRTVVHARGENVIRVSPETRMPKNYNRFVGLMEDLFARGAVPDAEAPLMTLERGTTLEALVRGLGVEEVVALSPQGEAVGLEEMFTGMGEREVACIIGGFAKGDFRSPVYDLCTRKISIHSSLLKVWTVASEVLVAYNSATSGGRA